MTDTADTTPPATPEAPVPVDRFDIETGHFVGSVLEEAGLGAAGRFVRNLEPSSLRSPVDNYPGSRWVASPAADLSSPLGIPIVNVEFSVEPRFAQYSQRSGDYLIDEAAASVLRKNAIVSTFFRGSLVSKAGFPTEKLAEADSFEELLATNATKENVELANKLSKFEQSTIWSKLVNLLPSDVRTETALEELWVLPFIASVARGDDTNGVSVNGVAFNGEEVRLAGELFDETSKTLFPTLQVEALGESVAATGEEISEAQASEMATAVLESLMQDDEIFVTVRPDIDETTESEVFADTDSGLDIGRDAEGNVDVTRAQSESYFDPFIQTGDDGAISVGESKPVMTSADYVQIARTGLIDWDTIVRDSYPSVDAQGRTIGATHGMQVELGELNNERQYDPTAGPGQQSFRKYSVRSATTSIYTMSPQEVGNLQDKLARAGYINPDTPIQRQDPNDPSTLSAWKQALTDAVLTNRTVVDVLKERVRNAPLIGQLNDMTNGWAQEKLGRDLRPSERYIVKRYITDWDRNVSTRPSTKSLSDQVYARMNAEFGREAEATKVQDVSLTLRGLAQQWEREGRGESDASS